jgi:predicted O-methyltransferase YrrM
LKKVLKKLTTGLGKKLMVENFSWIENKKENFKEYVLGIPDTDIEEILGSIPSGWNCPPESHRKFVEWIIGKINPQVTVELGVDYGYSSFIMSLCQQNSVYGIDCFDNSVHGPREDDDYQFVLNVKNKLKLNNLEIVNGFFDDVAKDWDKEIDLLHIDGLHDYKNCKNDCDTWSPLLKEDGVILFHDTVSNPNGAGLFFSQLEVPKVNFTNSCGLGVASNNEELIDEIKIKFNLQ